MTIKLNKASLKVKDDSGGFYPVMVLKDDSALVEEIGKRMKRYIVRLVKTGDNYVVQDYYTQAALSFDELKAAISDTSNYVVCVYGNSKLRPQYVSTSEMMFIGLDRASADAKVLRLLVTPTRTAYEVFSLASASDVSGKYTLPSTGIPEADLAEDVQEKLNSGGGISDVQINSTSIVQDGVANIPIAGAKLGAVKYNAGYGIRVDNTGVMHIEPATNVQITNRDKIGQKPISSNTFDFAVKAALCDGLGAAWTADEQVAAQARMGIYPMDEGGY